MKMSDFPVMPQGTLWSACLHQHLNDQWMIFCQSSQVQPILPALLIIEDELFWRRLALCWVGSSFAFHYFCHHPELLLAFAKSKTVDDLPSPSKTKHDLQKWLGDIPDETTLLQKLRQFRNKEQVRIIWCDLNRLYDFEATTHALSYMADACIEFAYQWLYQKYTPLFGVPINAAGETQHLVVIGMGKLGAYELNLSSDIDLIFAYPETGTTKGGSRALDNQEFFIKVGQKLIWILDQVTVDGFVFRVDMRLRPYGNSGPLVLSFDAMEQYYQDQGRDWERYAMVKARIVAGDKTQGDQLITTLKPFVYRRYLDFGAIDALREMKQLILREVQRKHMANNIKLGSGGIREVEFIGQMFQLVHGGRDRALQRGDIRAVLRVLGQEGYLSTETTQKLDAAYLFLRNTEHALQAAQDQQTQKLPESEAEQRRLACVMGYANWGAFLAQLKTHRTFVADQFAKTISDANQEDEDSADAVWVSVWNDGIERTEVLELLHEQGYQDPEKALDRLNTLRSGRRMRAARAQSLVRINQFMPIFLALVAEQVEPDSVLHRLLDLIETILQRSAYLVLLMKHKEALHHLIDVCQKSAWVAHMITNSPVLLDEFLHTGNLGTVPSKADLEADLKQQMVHIAHDDLEQQMESLRYFKKSHTLRVYIAELNAVLPVMKVSDYLTWIAELVLEKVIRIAWRQMVARYGEPEGQTHDDPFEHFAVIAYGKLGGIELGPGSDLDLVFVHDVDPVPLTDGEKAVENGRFFMRLAQRIVHILNVQTNTGLLYDIDTRLRPSGESGLLVTSLSAFQNYQIQRAWTWEHQALVRARMIAGSDTMQVQFAAIRQSALAQDNDRDHLKGEVLAMRIKMRKHFGSASTQGGMSPNAWQADFPYHLKHDFGGIIDIEFIVQYAVLAWSCNHAELLLYTDNFRILEQLEQLNLIVKDDALQLRQAYQHYRLALHRQTLQDHSAIVTGDQFHHDRQAVIRVWKQMFSHAGSN